VGHALPHALGTMRETWHPRPSFASYWEVAYAGRRRCTTQGQGSRSWGRSSVARAPALHAGGRGFESHRLHK
jgi:hypothetical protein